MRPGEDEVTFAVRQLKETYAFWARGRALRRTSLSVGVVASSIREKRLRDCARPDKVVEADSPHLPASSDLDVPCRYLASRSLGPFAVRAGRLTGRGEAEQAKRVLGGTLLGGTAEGGLQAGAPKRLNP